MLMRMWSGWGHVALMMLMKLEAQCHLKEPAQCPRM